MNVPFLKEAGDFLPFRAEIIPRQDVELHRHARIFFDSLLSEDSARIVHQSKKGNAFKINDALVFHLIAIFDCLVVLERSNPLCSTDIVETSVFYEYHPLLEVLLEYFLRQQNISILGDRAKSGRIRDHASEAQSDQFGKFVQVTRFCDGGREFSDSSVSLIACHFLAARSLRSFRRFNSIARRSIFSDPKKTVFDAAADFCSEVCPVQEEIDNIYKFFMSEGMKYYLDLRWKAYSQIVNKTVQYGICIVKRYQTCFMTMTEVQFGGDCWDDAAIRKCANQVGELFKALLPEVKKLGVVGHAWRLDTILQKISKAHPFGITVWRVRWLTFVKAKETKPFVTETTLAVLLRAAAERSIVDVAVNPEFCSSVMKDMTRLVVDQPPVEDGSEALPDYRQLIKQWVSELSMSEIYHRVRILEDARPKMCGRGHQSDGRAKKAKAQ